MSVPIKPGGEVLLTKAAAFLVLICFAKTNSPSYKLAINVAGQAPYYERLDVDGTEVHLAGFNDDPAALLQAAALARLVDGWKSAQFFVGGRAQFFGFRVSHVLACYSESSLTRDWRAHCLETVDSAPLTRPSFVEEVVNYPPMAIADQRPRQEVHYLFPCRYLRPWFWIDRHHPSSVEDQIGSLAVRQGCQWCPRFSASNFRWIDGEASVDP